METKYKDFSMEELEKAYKERIKSKKRLKLMAKAYLDMSDMSERQSREADSDSKEMLFEAAMRHKDWLFKFEGGDDEKGKSN